MSIRKFTKRNCEAYSRNSQRKQALDWAVTKFIIRDLQPLSVVDDVGFTDLVRELDPRYVLPSRRHLRDVLVTQTYEKTVENLSQILKNIKYVHSLSFISIQKNISFIINKYIFTEMLQ